MSIVLFLIWFSSVNGQNKTEAISLERNEEILNLKFYPNNGLLIKKGKDYMNSKSLDWEILFYKPNLDLQFKVPIEKTQINKGFTNFIVTSPDAKTIYHIEPKGYNTTFGASSQYITAIDSNGNRRTYEIEKLKDLGYRKSQFADNKNLYYVSSLEVKDPLTKKKKDKIMLIKLNNKDFSREDVELIFPSLKDDEYSSDWHYCGNGEKKIYFMSKTLKEDGTYIYDLLIIDDYGKIKKNLSLNCKWEGVYPRPSNNQKYYFWAESNDGDFYIEMSSNPNSTSVIQRFTVSAFGDIVVDEKNNSIYIYGLSGRESFPTSGSSYDSFYIFKFDMDGKEIWKNHYDFGKQIVDNKEISMHASPFKRKLLFKINPDNSFKFQMLYENSVYTFDIYKSGKLIDYYSNEFKSRFNTSFSMAFNPKEGSSGINYLNNLDPKLTKSFRYNLYNFGKSEIVLEEQPKNHLVNLLRFEK